ncbi:MAG: ferritin family protein [Gallionella sp.]|nr:ferritin family protein [Gallionella sp.]
MTSQLDISTLNLQDALDMAVLIEKEAEERYLLFADQLGKRYRGDAADFFTMMARNEQRHGIEIAERRRLLFGDIPSRVTENMIECDVEAPDLEKTRRYMSPRHALEIAMESEIKAYEFYDRALQGIQDPTVRKLIKELRDEEAEHQRLLNEQKVKYPDTMEPDLDPDDVEIPSL